MDRKHTKRNGAQSEDERLLLQKLRDAGVKPPELAEALGVKLPMASQMLNHGRGLNGVKYVRGIAAVLHMTPDELFSNGEAKHDTSVTEQGYHAGDPLPSSSPGVASNATFDIPSPSGTASISPDQIDPEALADAQTLLDLANEAKRIATESKRVAYKIVRRQAAIARRRQPGRPRKHRGLG